MSILDADLQHLLPPKILLLSKIIGIEDTLMLVEHHGNKYIYIPFSPTDNISFLSKKAQDLLCENYGGTFLAIPKCLSFKNAKRNAEIKRRRSCGEKIVKLAADYAVTYRWIHNIINE